MPPRSQRFRGARAFPPPSLPEQVHLFTATALVMGLFDVAVSAFRGGLDAGGAFVVAACHLVSMSLPPGVAAGVIAGTGLWAIRSARWLTPVRQRLGSPRRLLAADPEAFATGVGFLGAVAFVIVAGRAAALHFATRYHDPSLAAWAMAAAVLGLFISAVFVASLVAAVVRPVAKRAGRFSCGATVILLALAGVAAVLTVGALRVPRLFAIYDPLRLAWTPVALVLALVLAAPTRILLGRMSSRRLYVQTWLVVALVLLAIAWTGATYGDASRGRGVVEHQSVAGLQLVRFYADVTDRDRDGYAFAFGGEDCDDTHADVHPGASDPPGDGVDADCFAGDGSPDVADLGDGRYGEPPPKLGRPNFLLITIDALRADHLGSYGYARKTSPRMDSFAQESVRFENVIAQSSRSIRAVPAFRTGFYPSQIAYGPEYLWPALEQENTTVGEVLLEHGYSTAVVMGTDYFERVAHFFQGQELVDQINIYLPPRRMPIDHALRQLERLEKKGKPWMLWVHLFNVHEPYLWDHTKSLFGERPMDQYDTEIVLADREVGRLLGELDKRGHRDDTVVVLTADHGEAFGEHGSVGHSFTLYEEELRVPLLIRVPGLEPKVVRETVALFDVMPTLLNLANVDVPKPMPAQSLVPLMRGQGPPPKDRLLVSEILPDGLYPYDQKAIRRGQEKLIWWVRDGRFEFYDLAEDPNERRDLSDERRKAAEQLLGLLRAWVAETSRPEQRTDLVVADNKLLRPPREMTHPLDVSVGDFFTVLGFDLKEDEFRPGQRIPMTFYYEVHSEIDRDLFFYVDIKGPPGYRVPPHFHAHHYPINGRYHTDQWREGEIIRDPVEMVIPKDIRHPVTLKITLAVLGEDRVPLPYARGNERGYILDLAEVRVR